MNNSYMQLTITLYIHHWQDCEDFMNPFCSYTLQENGYQLLFLSARAISQAYNTRRFLFNLKQVISGEVFLWVNC